MTFSHYSISSRVINIKSFSEAELRYHEHVHIVERHMVSVSSEDDPLVFVEVRRMSVATRWLLVPNDPHSRAQLFLCMMVSSTSMSRLRSEVNVSGACQLARASVGALSLLHHLVVLIKADICVFDDEGILHLDRSRGQELLTWGAVLCCLLVMSCLGALCLR